MWSHSTKGKHIRLCMGQDLSQFDPHVRHILSWRLGHENISTAIFPLPLIQEEQCQLLAKECALSTGKLPRRFAYEQSHAW